jgi:hypothetical protein
MAKIDESSASGHDVGPVSEEMRREHGESTGDRAEAVVGKKSV